MTVLRSRYCLLLLVFVTLGIYYPVIFAPFNSVDDIKLFDNLLNTDHFDIQQIFLPGGSGYYYRPMLWVTFVADKYLWGLQESFMHLENILLHTVNAVLVFFLARHVFARRGFTESFYALIAALLFAVHPLNTEAVDWISGRTDPLAGFFILLSLLSLFAALERGSILLCLAAAGSFLLSCLVKETAVFFMPAALFVIVAHDYGKDVSFLQGLRKRLPFHCLFVAAAAAYFAIRHQALARGDTGIRHAAKSLVGSDSNLLYSLKVIVKVSGFYAKKLFIPWPLNFGIDHVSNFYILPGILLIVFMIYLLVRRDISAALFITSICVGSSSLIVAISRMAWTPISERYMYIPSATFAIAVVLGLATLARKHACTSIALSVMPVVLIAVGITTVSRNIVWQDNLSLFTDTVRKSPDFLPAKNDLAMALLGHGHTEEAYRILKANVMPATVNNNQLAGVNKAVVLAGEGDLEGARELLRELLKDPGKHEESIVKKLIAVNLKMLGKNIGIERKKAIRNEVIDLLKKEETLTGDPYYFYRIGQECLVSRRVGEAREYFARAYQAAPDGAYFKEPAKKLAENLR